MKSHSQAITIYQEKVHYSVYSQTKRLIDILGALVGLAITAIIFNLFHLIFL